MLFANCTTQTYTNGLVINASLSRLADEMDKGFKPIAGKISSMKAHLKKCQYVAPEVRQLAKDDRTLHKEVTAPQVTVVGPSSRSSALLALPTPRLQPSPLLIPATLPGSHQPLSPLLGFATPSPIVPDQPSLLALPPLPPDLPERPAKRAKISNVANVPLQWTQELKDKFQHDLCLAIISSGISWNAMSDVQLRQFFAEWIPGAEIPDRRKLSGLILDKEVARVISKTRLLTDGRFATGQCDGWKNIAKASVVTSMIIVDFEVRSQKTVFNLVTHI